MTEKMKMNPPSPWQPEKGQVNLAVIGKLGEEANELGSSCFRCVVQGIDGKHPVTEKANREWLTEEIADVLAGIEIAIQHFSLDRMAILERREMKRAHKLAWHKEIKEVLS